MKKLSTREGFSILWNLLYGFRRYYFVAICCMAVGACLTLCVPMIGRHIIDSLDLWKSDQNRDLWSDNRLLFPVLCIVGVSIVIGLFIFMHKKYGAHTAERSANKLRNRLYDHLQRLRCDYHDNSQTGDIVQRCSSDVDLLDPLLQVASRIV